MTDPSNSTRSGQRYPGLHRSKSAPLGHGGRRGVVEGGEWGGGAEQASPLPRDVVSGALPRRGKGDAVGGRRGMQCWGWHCPAPSRGQSRPSPRSAAGGCRPGAVAAAPLTDVAHAASRRRNPRRTREGGRRGRREK
jgi:hypothetical protein